MDPDPTLNFEQGEVIYEHPTISEWIRFWKASLGIPLVLWPAFYVFEIYANDGAPSLSWASENLSWSEIPRQFQDAGDWDLENVRYCDDHDYMNSAYGAKRMIVRPSHTMYQVAVLTGLQLLSADYVSKLVYNKDRDLVFAYKQDGLWRDSEYVYELHHLERMVPSPVMSYKDLSDQKEDGITTLYCMNSRDYLKLYNDPKYWNLDLRDDFKRQTSNLWDHVSDEFDGKFL